MWRIWLSLNASRKLVDVNWTFLTLFLFPTLLGAVMPAEEAKNDVPSVEVDVSEVKANHSSYLIQTRIEGEAEKKAIRLINRRLEQRFGEKVGFGASSEEGYYSRLSPLYIENGSYNMTFEQLNETTPRYIEVDLNRKYYTERKTILVEPEKTSFTNQTASS